MLHKGIDTSVNSEQRCTGNLENEWSKRKIKVTSIAHDCSLPLESLETVKPREPKSGRIDRIDLCRQDSKEPQEENRESKRQHLIFMASQSHYQWWLITLQQTPHSSVQCDTSNIGLDRPASQVLFSSWINFGAFWALHQNSRKIKALLQQTWRAGNGVVRRLIDANIVISA